MMLSYECEHRYGKVIKHLLDSEVNYETASGASWGLQNIARHSLPKTLRYIRNAYVLDGYIMHIM